MFECGCADRKEIHQPYVSYCCPFDIFPYMLQLIHLLVQIFEGSWDSDTAVTHYFYAPVVAQYVRINPQTWETHIAIRFELLGCKCKYNNYYL